MIKCIVLISGKQGSGKSTLARALVAMCWRARLEASLHRFAGALYTLHDVVLPTAKRLGLPIVEGAIDGTLLQVLGTEWGRISFGDDVWVKALEHEIGVISAGDLLDPDVVVVDDCRFPNELWLCPGVERVLVRLEANEGIRALRAQKWRENVDHPSECALDDYDGWDLSLCTNSMSVEEYAGEVFKIVEKRIAQCE